MVWFWNKQKRKVNANLPDGGVTITNAQELEEYLKNGNITSSGANVTPTTAMQVGAVFRSVSILSGAVANMPLAINKRVDDRTRIDASDHWLWALLRKKPNDWMTSSGFRKLLTLHVLLRGNGYALIVRSLGRVVSLIPMSPDKVEVHQLNNHEIVYTYTRKDGRKLHYPKKDIFHLMNLSFDGIVGVTPITYAKEAIGLSLQTEKHGAALFKNGTILGAILKHPKNLSEDAQERLKQGLEQYRGSENAYKTLLLEEGLEFEMPGMSQQDAQFIETRQATRTDIAMYFGVPPHMLGDTEKTTSWGTGIEQQSIGFVTYTLQDYLTMWEETIARDLITEKNMYAKFNTGGLVRGDIKTRTESQVKRVQFGINTVNEIRAENDENPTDGGDERYPPPNTNGQEGKQNESDQTTGD